MGVQIIELELEAMGQGCVPIVSSLPCFNEYVVPHRSGLIIGENHSGEIRDVASLLDSIISNDRKRNILKLCALSVSRKFNLSNVSNKNLQILHQILRNNI